MATWFSSFLDEWFSDIAMLLSMTFLAVSFERYDREIRQVLRVVVSTIAHFYSSFWLSVLGNNEITEDPVFSRSFLIDILLPIAVANDAQASINDMMQIWIEAHGIKKAKRIRRWQTIRIVVGHHALPVLGFFERVLTLVKGIGPAS